jgi:PAS domain S-box-containing protein
MHDAENTPEALRREIAVLRQRVAELETAAAEHTQKEVELQESEARYRLLAENVTDVIWVRDMQLRPIYISPSVTRLRGYSVEEAMSQTPLEALTPASREIAQQAFAHALTLERSGQAPLDRFRTLELEATRKDGSTVWIETSVTFLRDAEGRPVGFLGVNRDISARKQAEEALQQAHHALEARVLERTAALQRAEAESRGFFTHASVGMFACDPTGQFVKVNPAFCAFIGYSEAELLHEMTFWEITHPDFQEIMRQTNAHTVADTRPTTADEKQYARKDGAAVWGRVNSTWICDGDGNPIQIVGVVEDITEHKQAEEALRESEDRYRRVVEGSLQAILIHQDGILQYVNPACAQMFGYASPNELKGTNLWETLFAPESWEDIQARIAALLRGENIAVHPDFPGVRKDGSRIWIASTGSVITWHHQLAIVSFYTDVTARKEAEEERQRLETQLRQSQKMEAIGTLAGGIAHEFNNMLAAILGFTQLATAKVPSTSPVAQYLQAVETAGKRAKDLVQQLLTFSHPSDHQPEPVALALVIQEALKLLRATLPTTIEIRQQMAPTTGTVLADATQLHQVLMNLCANAEYAMRETGGILEISTDNIEVNHDVAAFHPDLQPGSHVRVRVRDTGVGIPADVIDRIFEPFFTTKSIGEGTGMGLAIVHGIVTRHSGVMTVESTPGDGSTFTIYLPQITHDTAHTADPPEPIMPQGAGRILFVDDEEVLARLGQALLERLGYDVVVFTSSLAALEAFQTEPYRFDLVITDQTMPAMSGATLVEELRHIRSDIPIILCTGFSHLMNAEKAEALGVDAFVMKPGVTQELAVAIQQVLEKRAQREP